MAASLRVFEGVSAGEVRNVSLLVTGEHRDISIAGPRSLINQANSWIGYPAILTPRLSKLAARTAPMRQG